jgi:DNA-binding NarL/FixJ family response regulator
MVVRHLSGGTEPELLLIDEQPQGPDPTELRALGLTPRESEVLALVARGQTNAEIAATLGTSPATVRKRLERVFRKVGVQHRTEAASVAYDALAFGADRPWH